jgi:hypothetical protein
MNRWIANTIGGLVILMLVVGGAVAAWRTWHKPSAEEDARKDLEQARAQEQAQARALAEQQVQDLKDGCESLNGSKDPVETAGGTPRVNDWRWGKPPAEWEDRSMPGDTAVTVFAGYSAINFEACWSPSIDKKMRGKFRCSAGGASTVILECKAETPPATSTTARNRTATTERMYPPGFSSREAYLRWRETHCTETRWELDCGE